MNKNPNRSGGSHRSGGDQPIARVASRRLRDQATPARPRLWLLITAVVLYLCGFAFLVSQAFS